MATIQLVTVQTPAPLKTYRTIGGNLFRVALEQLGDATQWNRVADINNISDPWLTGMVTLLIPPPLPSTGVTSAIIG